MGTADAARLAEEEWSTSGAAERGSGAGETALVSADRETAAGSAAGKTAAAAAAAAAVAAAATAATAAVAGGPPAADRALDRGHGDDHDDHDDDANDDRVRHRCSTTRTKRARHYAYGGHLHVPFLLCP